VPGRWLSGWFRRRWKAVLGVVLALVILFTAATARLFVWPAQGAPAEASAIVMLAGPGDRLPVALRLAREHLAPQLVVSRGWQGYGGPCPAPVPGVRLTCFNANPGNTRGEAEYVGRLAAREHWHSVILVATATQDTRARIIVGRCFGGAIYVVTAPQPRSTLPYQIAYGWAALVKALTMKTSC
jgi:hypothetical protein